MRPNCCHFSLAFVLKFLNFLQAFVGVSILLYSIWMLNQWDHYSPQPPFPQFSISLPRSFSPHFVSDINLPAPWFMYAFMGVGILVCCISFFGCVAAEIINGCCLCFYTLLITVLVLLEAALVGFIAIDHQWQDVHLPFEPTGQLESLRSFIEDNQDICRWVGIAVLVVQALSLLVALILRASVSTRREDFDDEEEYDVRGRSREPLLNPQSGQTSGGNHSDVWSSRMREKYGLNNGDKNSYEA